MLQLSCPNRRSVSMLTLAATFLGVFINSILTYNLASDNPPCGVLYFGENYTGITLSLRHQEQSVNLEDDYRQHGHNWNGTTGSIKLEKNCRLFTCHNAYLIGRCKTIEEGNFVKNWTKFLSEIQCDDHTESGTCAKAYMDKSKGCVFCNENDYLEIRPDSNEFPSEFHNKIKTLCVRKGCSLKLNISDDQSLDVNETEISEENFENFTGTIDSYNCQCNDISPNKLPTTLPTPEYSPLINIPDTMEDIVQMLGNNQPQHPALIAALQSLKSKRSSKNTYILVLGSSGSGKSSGIRTLFGNTKLGEDPQACFGYPITEFRTHVPVAKFGVNNSELRVIDTRGLGDTRGIQQDALFLATLDEYLANHEELKDHIPNVVLVFHRFTDNRFESDFSTFQKMLRSLNSFRDRITDGKFSNVIFVLSHFESEKKQIRLHPKQKLKMFKQVIEKTSLFPQPILISVAENRARENDLPIVNGFFKLSNNELYPQNLMDQIEFVTQNREDLIGLSVLQEAFKNGASLNVTKTTKDHVPHTHPKTQYYLHLLSNNCIECTPISKLLNRTYLQIPDNLKNQHLPSLQYLQREWFLRDIFTTDNLPNNISKIIELYTSLKQNESTIFFLENSLNLTAPVFPFDFVVGQSYNVLNNTVLSTSPLNVSTFQYSDTGFKFPMEIGCKLNGKGSNKFSPGFNLDQNLFKDNGTVLSSLQEYSFFQCFLNKKFSLNESLANSDYATETFDFSNENKLDIFDKKYGTNIVSSAYGGGSIEIKLKTENPFDAATEYCMNYLINFITNKLFVPYKNYCVNGTLLTNGVKYSLKFSGGNSKFYVDNFTNMTIDEATVLLENWKTSLKYNPVMLTTNIELLPLSQAVKRARGNVNTVTGINGVVEH